MQQQKKQHYLPQDNCMNDTSSGKCPFWHWEAPITLEAFQTMVPGMTIQRPKNCPGEISSATLANIVSGKIERIDMPWLEAVRRTVTGIICRSGVVEFLKHLDTFADDIRTEDLSDLHKTDQASIKFIDFMHRHFQAAVRGCPAGMIEEEYTRVKTILGLTNLPPHQAEHFFTATIKTPAITSHNVLCSLIRDGDIAWKELYETASTISLDFVKRELSQIATFEAMINTYTLQMKWIYPICYDTKTRAHSFNMACADVLPGVKNLEEVHVWCGAMRIPGIPGSKNTLFEDFFLTIAKLYAGVTKMKE